MQNKKIIAVFILLVFLAALALGGSAVFTVANVECNAYLYGESKIKEFKEIEETLKKFEGKNIITLKVSDIKKSVDNYKYFEICNIKKSYPNKIELDIKERKEIFSVKFNDNIYFSLDINAKYITNKNSNINDIDNFKNITLNPTDLFSYKQNNLVIENQDNIDAMVLAIKTISESNKETNNFNVRNFIEQIYISNKINLVIETKQGLLLNITNFKEDTIFKIKSALICYNKLSSEEIVAKNAEIIVIKESNGKISSTYSVKSDI